MLCDLIASQEKTSQLVYLHLIIATFSSNKKSWAFADYWNGQSYGLARGGGDCPTPIQSMRIGIGCPCHCDSLLL